MDGFGAIRRRVAARRVLARAPAAAHDGEAGTRRPSAPIHRLLQDSSLYLLGNVAGRVVGFLAIPFYSRFLSAAEYGLLELIELSTQTVAIAFGLQAIGAALSRLFHDQSSPEGERAVVSTSLIATAVLSAVVSAAAAAAAGPLSVALFHTPEWTGLLQAAFVAMFFGNMVEVVMVYERIRNNARFFLGYSLVTLVATLGLNIVFIGFMGFGVWGFVSSKLIVTVLACGVLFQRMRRDVGWQWRGALVPGLARFGAPLIVSSLSYFAIHFSDRFFLKDAVSLADLGRYALAYRFAFLVSALVGDSFAKSWGVTLYRYTGEPGWKERFARVAAFFTYVLFLTGLAIALFSPELLRIMVPPDFFPPPLLLPVLIASYLVREIGDFFRSLMLINKRAMLVGNVALGGAVLNLAVNAALIPAYGIMGAAWATLLTWAAYMVVCWAVANREHRLPIPVRAYVRLAVLLVAVYAAAMGSRVHPFAWQVLLDGVWTLVFAAAAIAVFLSAGERRAALGLAGSIALWVLTRGAPDEPQGEGGRSHVLMLAYHYPPENEVGAARPHRFATYLRRAGTDVDVVTAAPAADSACEPHVHRVGCPAEGAMREGAWPLRVGGRALHAAERLVLPYQDRLGWFPAAFAAAVRIAGPGTVVLSTHPPVVTHLVAYALARRYGLTWVADFRDPFWGNPFRKAERAAALDPVLERLTVEHADAVIANTEAAAALLRSRYPARRMRIHVIWNGFDPEDGLRPVPAVAGPQQVIAHVGTLYGDRSPMPLLRSLARLQADGRLAPGGVRFSQVGRATQECLDKTDPVVAALVRDGACTIKGHVPPAEAHAAMLAADWLLLLDMNEVNAGLQVPAKLFDYVRTGRPVLALTVPGSSVEHVLALSGVAHACIDVGLPPEAFDEAVLAFLRRPVVDSAPTAAFAAAFGAPQQVEALRGIIAAARAGG